jgi:hypothetical protein
MKISALAVSVYRHPLGDCTNNGISNRFRELLVYCPSGPRSFFSEHELPLNFCAIVHGCNGYRYLVPAMVDEDGAIVPRPGWFMYGGNIADTSDSRFNELTGVNYPLHIHDRKEW